MEQGFKGGHDIYRQKGGGGRSGGENKVTAMLDGGKFKWMRRAKGFRGFRGSNKQKRDQTVLGRPIGEVNRDTEN